MILGVAIPLVLFRLLAPERSFPVSYRRGKSAHLSVEGRRGEAIRRALAEQLGIGVVGMEPFGTAGSAGSTPLRIRVAGEPPADLFGKLYAVNHLRSDRWYKLGRMILYGALEDEKPFNSDGGWNQVSNFCCFRATPTRLDALGSGHRVEAPDTGDRFSSWDPRSSKLMAGPSRRSHAITQGPLGAVLSVPTRCE